VTIRYNSTMTNVKHTSGPWRALPDGTIVAGPNGTHVAYTANTGMGRAFAPNAALIAAAPELLAALVMVRDADDDCIRDGFEPMPRTPRAKIDAAIAAAEGRS